MSLKKRVIFILPLATLLLAGFGCGKKPAPAPAAPPANVPVAEEPGSSMDMRIAGNTIVVGEQRPNSSVKLWVVATDKPAFVIVREQDRDRGEVIGKTALLRDGENNEVTIPLSRSTVHGETLHVLAFADDGNGTFGPEDPALLDYEGKPVYAEIMINAEAEEGPAPVL